MSLIKIENDKKRDKLSPWRTPIFQQKKSDDIPFYFFNKYLRFIFFIFRVEA